jgi:hypothetical protein
MSYPGEILEDPTAKLYPDGPRFLPPPEEGIVYLVIGEKYEGSWVQAVYHARAQAEAHMARVAAEQGPERTASASGTSWRLERHVVTNVR